MQKCLGGDDHYLIRHMRPSASVSVFEQFVENRGGSLPDLRLRAGGAEMLAFYETILPTGCSNQNGDMLLFQWGTYDWGDGNGKCFEVNITRQFIESAQADDDAISQLQLTFKFPPIKETTVLGSGNRWCKSRAEIDAFREFIYSIPAFRAKADSDAPDISLHHEYV